MTVVQFFKNNKLNYKELVINGKIYSKEELAEYIKEPLNKHKNIVQITFYKPLNQQKGKGIYITTR